MIEFFITGAIIAGLLIASYSDIKTREVPDWVNFSLIAAGIGIRLIMSAVQMNPMPLIEGAIGMIAGVVIAYTMFYAGQWGGGDSKLLMGLGALIGIKLSVAEVPFFFSFLINTFLIGAVYGFIWALILAIRRRKDFVPALKKIAKNNSVKIIHAIVIIAAVAFGIIALLINDFMLRLGALLIAILTLATFYLYVFIKSIEESCMKKYVAPDKLTEGDWIVEDIVYKGKRICGPKDLGIEKKQIQELMRLYKQKKVKRVLIKEGIPFVPSFLIGYLMTLILGNIILIFIHV